MFKKEKKSTTPFSKFIREAKASDKKKVYKKVIEKSIEEQKSIIKKAVA